MNKLLDNLISVMKKKRWHQIVDQGEVCGVTLTVLLDFRVEKLKVTLEC